MITVNKVILRKKTLSDARDDYRWQKDAELARLDAGAPRNISYARFLAEYSFELYYPLGDRREFAIESPVGVHIGNCVYYNISISRGEAELGIIIGERDYWGKGYGTAAINALLEHVFTHTGINRVYLKTLDWNIRAQRCFAKCGFKPAGNLVKNGYNFVSMELYRHPWQTEQREQSRD